MAREDRKLHLSKIRALLKEQPFWKTALFGVQCLRRQQPVYQRLCAGREWDNAKGMAEVMDRLYRAVSAGQVGGFGAELEDSAVTPAARWDALAAAYVENTGLLLELLEAKDRRAAEIMAGRNLSFLDLYARQEAAGEEGLRSLEAAERAFQLRLAVALREAGEKGPLLRRCREAPEESILRDAWFSGYPDYKPLARRGPGDGLRFRTACQTACVGRRDYQLCRESEERCFRALEAYRASPYYGLPPAESAPEALRKPPYASHAVFELAEGRYLDYFKRMGFRYFSRGEDLYLRGADMGEVLRALCQAGECAILSTRLWQREERPLQRPGWGYQHSAAQLAMLIYRYDFAFQQAGEGAYTRLLLHLLRGETEEAGEALGRCVAEREEIYQGADYRMAEALCGGEAEEIRAAAARYLRAIRAMEDLYREVFPLPLILSVRCAAQMGVDLRPIEVSELPKALIGPESPFDYENSRPIGAELAEALLDGQDA